MIPALKNEEVLGVAPEIRERISQECVEYTDRGFVHSVLILNLELASKELTSMPWRALSLIPTILQKDPVAK